MKVGKSLVRGDHKLKCCVKTNLGLTVHQATDLSFKDFGGKACTQKHGHSKNVKDFIQKEDFPQPLGYETCCYMKI